MTVKAGDLVSFPAFASCPDGVRRTGRVIQNFGATCAVAARCDDEMPEPLVTEDLEMATADITLIARRSNGRVDDG